MTVIKYIVVIAIAYLMGSLSVSVIISGSRFGADIRSKGSGNAGATNMARIFGIRTGVITFMGDVLKTVPPLMLGHYLLGDLGLALAGIAATIGHCYPIYYGFKGGKGVSAGTAVAFAIDWRVGLILLVIFSLVALCGKKVSLASISVAVGLPIVTFLMSLSSERLILAVVAACIAIIRHKDNIKRLINGTEPNFKPADKKKDKNNSAREQNNGR